MRRSFIIIVIAVGLTITSVFATAVQDESCEDKNCDFGCEEENVIIPCHCGISEEWPDVCSDVCANVTCYLDEGYTLCLREVKEVRARCFCGQGTVLEADNGTQCIDIDECADEDHGCQQSCQNVIGSYVSTCAEGFIVNPLKQSQCIAVEQFVVRLHFALLGSSRVIRDNSTEAYGRLKAHIGTQIFEMSTELDEVTVTKMTGSLDVTVVLKASHRPGQSSAAGIAKVLLRIAHRGLPFVDSDHNIVPTVKTETFEVTSQTDICDVREAIEPCDGRRDLYCDVIEGGACVYFRQYEGPTDEDILIVLGCAGVGVALLLVFLVVCCVCSQWKNNPKSATFDNRVNSDIRRFAFEESGQTSMFYYS